MAALTVYPTNTADTLVTTADTLVTAAPSSETSKTSKTGKSTGWGQLRSQGNTTTWNANSTENPTPDGHGYLWDVTTLEGQTIAAGTWTYKVKVTTSSGAHSADIHVRAFKRSSAGVYTLISEGASGAVTVNATGTVHTITDTGGLSTDFATGDKLYIDVQYDIITNSSSSATATTSLFKNLSTNESIVTPGFAATAVLDALTGEVDGAATVSADLTVSPLDALAGEVDGTSAATGALTVTAGSVLDALAGEVDGAAVATGGLSLTKSLAGTLAGVAVVSSPDISLGKPLGGSVAGVAALSGGLSLGKALAAAVSGVATVAGDLTAAAGGVVALAGSIAGSAVLSGALSVGHSLAGLVSGTSNLVADIKLSKPLGGLASGVGQVGSVLSLMKLLGASSVGTSLVTGSLSVLGGVVNLAGSVSGVASLIGALFGSVGVPVFGPTGVGDGTSSSVDKDGRHNSVKGDNSSNSVR